MSGSALGGSRRTILPASTPASTKTTLRLPKMSYENGELNFDWINTTEVTGMLHDKPFAQGISKKAFYVTRLQLPYYIRLYIDWSM